jgi:hypothetical protein
MAGAPFARPRQQGINLDVPDHGSGARLSGHASMNSSARGALFAAGLLVGLLVFVFQSNVQAINAYLHASELRMQDWLCLVFGPLGIIAGGYNLTRSGPVDWRWGVPLVLGVAALYAEIAGVTWLKDTLCLFFQGRHESGSRCFQ